MSRPIQALIHAEALAHNLGRARAMAPDAKVWAVVKANAYGHGLAQAAPALWAADGLACLEVDEAQRLRDLGWRGPILLLEGVFEARELELCSRLQLWHAVHCREQIDMLAAHKTHWPHRVFLKMNSGMNRLGFRPTAFRGAFSRLQALPQVEEITLMTHFADADGAGGIAEQARIFAAHTQDLPGERSLANSATVLRHGPTLAALGLRSDWVRAGIMLYGSSPDHPEHDIAHWGLRPAMSLKARVIGVQQLDAGDRVGYGGRFAAERPMRIGIVACGYADGYPRICPTGTPAWVDGQPSRTVGRVSMDMLAVELPEGAPGREVTLWGRTGEAGGADSPVLPIDEVAAAAQTIGYELMCAVAPRVPRVSVLA